MTARNFSQISDNDQIAIGYLLQQRYSCSEIADMVNVYVKDIRMLQGVPANTPEPLAEQSMFNFAPECRTGPVTPEEMREHAKDIPHPFLTN